MTEPAASHPDYSLSTMALHAVLIGQPHAKIRPRISAGVAGRRPRTHQDPRDKAAEDVTRGRLVRLNWPLQADNVWLRVQFYRDSRQVVDLDNLEKHLMDCGNGVLWVDDCQITQKTTSVHLDRFKPRTEIWVGLDYDASMTRDRSGAPYDKAMAQLATWRTGYADQSE